MKKINCRPGAFKVQSYKYADIVVIIRLNKHRNFVGNLIPNLALKETDLKFTMCTIFRE